jgi:large subunit ribosomal protein L10
MVSEKNKSVAKDIGELIGNSPVVGVLDLHKLPARNLFEIKGKLGKDATIRVAKKRVMKLALEKSEREGMASLAAHIGRSPALILSSENPFSLARKISASKAAAPAKPGDVAPSDIVVKAGPTKLAAGPAIGDLQRAKIPAMVQDGKISVRQDTVVVKKGDTITTDAAGLLSKLGIEPMEVGLDLRAAWEDRTIYAKDILFIPREKYVGDLERAHAAAFNVAYAIGFYTPQNVRLFLSRAGGQAESLALKAGILTSRTAKLLLWKARSQALALKAKADAESIGAARGAGENDKKEDSKE